MDGTVWTTNTAATEATKVNNAMPVTVFSETPAKNPVSFSTPDSGLALPSPPSPPSSNGASEPPAPALANPFGKRSRTRDIGSHHRLAWYRPTSNVAQVAYLSTCSTARNKETCINTSLLTAVTPAYPGQAART
jgi:hypothetical protein